VKGKIESSRIFYLLKIKIDESSQELCSKMFKKKLKKKITEREN
jgi:hypothetical protein